MSGTALHAPGLTGPIRLVTPGPVGSSHGMWVVWAVLVGLLVVGCVVGVVWARRRRCAVDDGGFGVLCRSSKLDAGAQELVRKLAVQIGAEPVALLLSGSAFRRAALLSMGSMSKRARARVGELERRLHPGLGAGAGRHGGRPGAEPGQWHGLVA